MPVNPETEQLFGGCARCTGTIGWCSVFVSIWSGLYIKKCPFSNILLLIYTLRGLHTTSTLSFFICLYLRIKDNSTKPSLAVERSKNRLWEAKP